MSSKSIDQRIVEMQFNNKQFESGVKTSVSSLDKLKKSLDLDKAAASLSALEKAGNKFSLAGMEAGIQSIADRFSNMGIIGMRTLEKLVDTAFDAGRRIISALTIGPITTGLKEYETKMGAITTILTNTASKGTTLDDVNAALEELNKYADLTIYNFTEMTRNIGTFTAAGIDLERSTTAIKGIANLAAGSGSTAQQASTAMYQLSQALASGTVKLMDWNSVVNAGMGGELFKQALIDTAKELGKTTPKMENFRDSLQDGWITTDVLIKTLEKFANDESLIKAATQVKTFTQLWDTMQESVQSGWAQTWEYIIGDKDQATELLTGLSDGFNAMIQPSTDARNSMFKFWNEQGGRKEVLEGISKAIEGITNVLEPFKKAWSWAFQGALSRDTDIAGKNLVKMSVIIRQWGYRLKIVGNEFESLGGKNALMQGLLVAFDSLKKLLHPIGSAFKEILGIGNGWHDWSTSLTNLAKGFENLMRSVKPSEATLNNINRTFKGLFAVVDIGLELFKALAKQFGNILNLSSMAGDGLLGFTGSIGDFLVGVRDAIKDGDVFNKIFTTIGDTIKKIAGVAGKYLSPVITRVKELFKGFDFYDLGNSLKNVGKEISNLFNSFGGDFEFKNLDSKTQTLVLTLKNAWIEIKEVGGTLLKGFWNSLKGFIYAVATFNQAFANTIRAIGEKIKEVFHDGITFDEIMGILKTIFSAKVLLFLNKFMNGISNITANTAKLIGGAAEALSGIAGTLNAYQKNLKANALLKIAAAIGILVAAVVVLSFLDTEKLTKSIAALGFLFAELTIATKILASGGGINGISKSMFGLIGIGAAILMFSASLKSLSELSWEEIGKGITALTLLIGDLLLLSIAIEKKKGSILKMAISIGILAGAIKLIIPVLSNLGDVPLDTMVGISALLLGISGAMAIASKIPNPAIAAKAGLALGAFVGIIAGVGLILGGIASLLDLIPGMDTVAVINKGGEIFLAVGTAIGNLVGGALGGIIGGVAAGVTSNLPIIGEHLSKFYETAKPFLDGMADLDEGVAKSALALAGVILALTAANVIKGVSDFLGISNDFSNFSQGLKDFGKAIYDFSLEVKDLDPNVVVNATNAGKALVELANTLPNSGGILGKIMGENDWTTFTNGLVPFGTAMMQYSKEIAGLDANVVINSSLAGKALADLASQIPNTGGAVAWFTGDNQWSVFSDGLVTFGQALASYSQKVKNVDPDIVTNTANAGKALAELAAMIPNAGGIASWFVGENSLEHFSSGIKGFGDALKIFYDSVSGINVFTLHEVIKQANNLVNMAKGMSEIDPWGMQNFGYNLNLLAENGIQGFITAFQTALPDAEVAAMTFIETFSNGLLGGEEGSSLIHMEEIGRKLTDALIGLEDETGLRYNKTAYEELGRLYGHNFSQEFYNKWIEAYLAGIHVTKRALEGLRLNIHEFYNVGVQAGEGFVNGLSSMMGAVSSAGSSLGKAALEAAKAALDSHSPSRKYDDLGVDSGQGLVNGLKRMTSIVGNTAFGLGQTAVDRLGSSIQRISDVVNNNLDTNPTIRPVLDLDQLVKDTNSINGLFGQKTLDVSNIAARATVVSGQNRSHNQNPENLSKDNNPKSETKYEFNQYNTSPKALSRLEIYRDTKNLFALSKEVIEKK